MKKWLRVTNKTLKKLSFKLLVVLIVVSFIITGFALRSNNLTMIKLRQQVYDADKNNTDVEKPLNDLREYVFSHMNTDLSSGNRLVTLPIQLSYSYDRALTAEKDRIQKSGAQIAADAQKYCELQVPKGHTIDRVPCVEKYTSEHSSKELPVDIEYYTFNFVSPLWTPDFAGFSLLFSFILVFIAMYKILLSLLVASFFKKTYH